MKLTPDCTAAARPLARPRSRKFKSSSTFFHCHYRTGVLFILLLHIWTALETISGQQQQQPATGPNEARPSVQPQQVPTPVQSASYISLDGLNLVIVFNKPVNLSAAIESVEQRLAAANAGDEQEWAGGQAVPAAESSAPAALTRAAKLARPADPGGGQLYHSSSRRARLQRATVKYSSSRARRREAKTEASWPRSALLQVAESGGRHETLAAPARDAVCPLQDDENEPSRAQETAHVIAGVQLCAHFLTRKSLRLLHKFRLHNCLWPSQLQFLIQLARPIKGGAPGAAVKIAFRRGTLREQGQPGGRWNEQEVGVELNKLPLEGLGVPLAPRLALTGPNQLPPCGQFSLSAHLASPYGTQLDESVRLQWSVERVGLMANASGEPAAAAGSASEPAAGAELQWRLLRQLVGAQRANNLVLDAQLLQFAPQLYEFRLQATFLTSVASFTLNATHQVSRLDFEAPIGAIYGSHLLGLEQQVGTNSELTLVADVQVPECATNIKQVGLYWQVSDPRVRFEQTYAPFYLARSNTLPEQALVEFRLNLFYGIRVKKFASASALVQTGDSVLDAQISDGLLMTSIGQPQEMGADRSGGREAGDTGQLELFAISRHESGQQHDKYTYQWSCFDGKTAQPCYKSLKVQASSGGTRYDIGTPSSGSARARDQQNALARPQQQLPANNQLAGTQSGAASGLLLVDRARQRQPILRLPLSYLEADAQLWFGLQRFDRHNPSQHSKTEYALVSVYPLRARGWPEGAARRAPVVSIGPVLMGRARQRASLRNPLTGAIVLLAHTPAVLVGRLNPALPFVWHIPNYLHPLHWTSRNVTNPLNGQLELVTELHLNADLLLAHAHYQVQLQVCSQHAGATSLASISVDVVEGVSQCRVELMGEPVAGAAGLPLVVGVNNCNIPLGLSPLTYQLYIVDTSAPDAFMAHSSTNGTGAPAPKNRSALEEDDYTNEADEIYFESQAQPLTIPQLSPVFQLGGLSAFALMALVQNDKAGQQGAPFVRIRFGARVCHRLHTCKMFYSNSIDPIATLAQNNAELSTSTPAQPQPAALEGANEANRSAAGARSERLQAEQRRNNEHAIQTLKVMLEGAKRANLAGNSMAAISMLNAVMTLGQRLLQQTAASTSRRVAKRQNYRPGGEPDDGDAGEHSSAAATESADSEGRLAASERALSEQQAERLQNLLQAAMRDCLHFGAQSIQRQFHYTESGQTNLVLLALSRILTLQHDHFEHKYRAIRLIGLLIRKSMELSPATGRGGGASRQLAGSLPDLKSIQAAYESLFSTFGQHSIDSLLSMAPTDKQLRKRHNLRVGDGDENHHHNNNNKNNATSNRSATGPREADAELDNNNGNLVLLGARSNSSSSAAPSWRPAHWNNDFLPPQASSSSTSMASAPGTAAATTTTDQPLTWAASSVSSANMGGLRTSSRRNKEEAILAYLRAVRHTHRALIQAAAAQLPLGAVQQFEYQTAGSPPAPASSSAPAAVAVTAPTLSESSVFGSQKQQQPQQQSAKFVWAQQPAANIVSSLTHQADLQSDTIDVDLHEFGSISLKFLSPPSTSSAEGGGGGGGGGGGDGSNNVLAQVTRQLAQAHVRCRNDTRLDCSSFVLALTSFAGKAPFRSLDPSQQAAPGRPAGSQQAAAPLRVPVIQIDWLSSIDGSSLVDAAGSSLSLDQFKASVTFNLPEDLQANESNQEDKYKCYQFVESSNEWLEVEQADSKPEAGEPDGSGGAGGQRRFRCLFPAFGVLGAFQGRPPAVGTPIELSIVLGVACCLAIVTIFSLLGCIASKSKAKRRGQHRRQQSGELDERRRSSADELDNSSRNGSTSSSYESGCELNNTRINKRS